MENNPVFCKGCKYKTLDPDYVSKCRMFYVESTTPIRISRDPIRCEVQNKDNDCKFWSPNLFERLKIFFGVVGNGLN